MSCNMYSSKNNIFPLDYIFKSIHSSELFPFIKYGTSSKQEQLIRLHLNDSKQPVLSKSEINKLMVSLKKTSGISVYVNTLLRINNGDPTSDFDKNTWLMFELSETGKIKVLFDTLNTTPINSDVCIEEILRLVNEFSNQINTCLQNYDIKLPIYAPTIDNVNIQITTINYSELYESTSFKQYIPDIKRPIIPAILYPLNLENKKKDTKILTNIKYLYTRVSNFNYEQEFNEVITPYMEVAFNINKNQLCISINNVSSFVYISVLKEYISKYITLMNDPSILKIFKTDGILKYNLPIEDINQPVNIQEPGKLLQDIERFDNDEIEEDVENDNFLNTLLKVQNVDNYDDGISPPRGGPADDMEDDEDIDLNDFDFDNELGEIDTI